MSARLVLCLAALCLSSAHVQDAARDLQAGRYADVIAATAEGPVGETQEAARLRYELRLQALHQAGDLVGVWVAAQSVPGDCGPYAPFLAARVAVDLDRPAEAQKALERLRGALEGKHGLAPEAEQWYRDRLADLESRVAEREQVSERTAGRVRTAQGVLAGLAGLLALALVGGLRRVR
ncbi:MAG: hypothetical protein R3F33_08725 [Planctomycetota bacterium]